MPELPPAKRQARQKAERTAEGQAAPTVPFTAEPATPTVLPFPADQSSRQRRDALSLPSSPPAIGYAELHCKTNFSFLEGASHPDELVEQAAALGLAALAITDRNSLAGVVRAHVAAKAAGLKLLIGAEITPTDAPPVVLLATDRAAYGRLCRLITLGRCRADKGDCRLSFDDVAQHAEGLVALVVPQLPFLSPLMAENNSIPSPSMGGNSFPSPLGGGGLGRGACVPSEPPSAAEPQPNVGRSATPSYKPCAPRASFHSEEPTPTLPHTRCARSQEEQARTLTLRGDDDAVEEQARIRRRRTLRGLQEYRAVFGDRCYLFLERHYGPDDTRHIEEVLRLSKDARLPLVAANDVHFHHPDRQVLQDVLTAVRHGCTVAQAKDRLFANAERYLKSPQQMLDLFPMFPEAVARTVEIADRCRFSLDELRYEYPEELCPAGQSPFEHLTRLTWEGAAAHYPAGIPDKVRQLIEHELALIAELRYEAYFLTVWDLVRFARSRGILCQGRGSAANSAVCFCLGVTAVDPERIDVLFERFVSRERNEAPDIDVDFEHERREEVLQYLYDKYGRERAGMTAEVITYQPRSAVRDVGKALGLSLDRVDTLAKSLDVRGDEAKLAARFREAGFDPSSPVARQLVTLVRQLIDFPRHLSQHVGGMVMTQGPLCELVPIENAAMPGRTVIEWDKDDLDSLGILKVDCLALGMLTAIHRCFDLIERHTGRRLTLATVPAEDPAVYEMIGQADTMGVFQIESRAQMAMLPRLKPRVFYDLVIEVAIVRPGPIQGDMVHPYLRRRAGLEPVEYPSPAVRQVLEKTLGVPLFQEQAMRLAMVAAGFTPGEADQLRRAMGAWRRSGVIEQFRQRLVDGMKNNGFTAEFAERVFQQIRGFGEYGFPESHAASFALLVYISAWLKRFYPAAFAAALVNSQPMGFYAPAQLVRDARQHGVEVRPVDVNCSEWDCTLEPLVPSPSMGGNSFPSPLMGEGGGGFVPSPWMGEGKGGGEGRRKDDIPEATPLPDPPPRCAGGGRKSLPSSSTGQSGDRFFPSPLMGEGEGGGGFVPSPWMGEGKGGGALPLRLGLRILHGFPQSAAERIVAARRIGPFTSVADLARRASLSRAVLARLAKADALASLQLDRRAGLWQALDHSANNLPLFADMEPIEPPTVLPALTLQEEVLADYQTAGLSLKAHPMTFLRPQLNKLRAVPAAELDRIADGRWVRLAGLVLLRQRPSTAKGVTFVTLEDETGIGNLIIRQEVWERYRRPARAATAMLASGRLQKHAGVIHLLTEKIEDLSRLLAGLRQESRDFR